MSIQRLFFKLPLLLLFLLILSGCIGHKPYRTVDIKENYETCTNSNPELECTSNSFQLYDGQGNNQDYMLGFVEFDDQGQLWDRRQLNHIDTELNVAASDSDILLVVFAHGWKHSAKPGDNNITMFRNTLKLLSAVESDANPDNPRKVAGVYLGWRGGSVSLPVIKELSFWERKNTAHKVGSVGVTEVLSKLQKIKQTKQQIARNSGNQSNTRLVVVGHSFGGAVVYTALSSLLQNGFVITDGPGNVASETAGFADLVVLLNPAFEAIRFSTLSDMANERGTYPETQLPTLAVLTSEADYATKLAFPAGRWFSTLFEKERKVSRINKVTGLPEVINQGSANLRTIGHFENYITHELHAVNKEQDPQFCNNPNIELDNAERMFSTRSLFARTSQSWEDDAPNSEISFNESILKRSENSVGQNPFLNIKVDKRLIPDHNEICDPRIQSFVRQLILISTQDPSIEEREKVRSRFLK